MKTNNTEEHENAFANDWEGGLTKREYFAGQAMMGLLVTGVLDDHDCEIIAKHAVNQADALINALNKPS